MPKIVFTELQKGVTVGKGTFNVIKGNSTYDGKPWEKRYFASNAAINSVTETLQPGDKVECVTVKQGNFWNLERVEIMERGNGQAPPAPQPATPPAAAPAGKTQQGQDYKKREKVATAGGFRPPEDISRTESLKLSVEVVKACLDHPASHEGPLTFPEACVAALEGAEIFNGYITGKKSAAGKSTNPAKKAQAPAEAPADHDTDPEIPFD